MKREIIIGILSFILGCWLTNIISTPTVKELERARINIPEEEIEVYTEKTLPKRQRLEYTYNNKPEIHKESVNTGVKPRQDENIRNTEENIDKLEEMQARIDKLERETKKLSKTPGKTETKTAVKTIHYENGVRLKEKIPSNINVELPGYDENND